MMRNWVTFWLQKFLKFIIEHSFVLGTLLTSVYINNIQEALLINNVIIFANINNVLVRDITMDSEHGNLDINFRNYCFLQNRLTQISKTNLWHKVSINIFIL